MDFPDLGARCDEARCRQLDLLPFECDGCGGVFCAAHRARRDHGCAMAADPGRTVVVCPRCGDAIDRTVLGLGDQEILDAHWRSRRCDPARKRKPRCPARGCEAALTLSMTAQCNACGLSVCLKQFVQCRCW